MTARAAARSRLDFRQAWRNGRAKGVVLALVVEALFVLIVLSLGASITGRKSEELRPTVVTLSASQQPETETPEQNEPEEIVPDRPPVEPSKRPPDAPEPPDVVTPPAQVAASPAPPVIRISPSDMAAADIAPTPQPVERPAAPRAMMGPPDTGSTMPDTPRVGGAGPNGEPLYAASWYREPYDSELRGYLSTAAGPGWGLIACRTAPDFRVEDCFKIDEYPAGSNIARSVLAAAWQFRVRPPRVGGRSKIGEWVRIRIDYDLRRETRAGS